MTLLEELVRENAERERKKRQASQDKAQSQKRGVVAIYALCERGDRSSLILAQNVCKQKGWVQPLEYVDSNKAERYEWKNLIGDIALGDHIAILVTYFVSLELEKYCAQYNCTLVEATV